MGAGAVVLDGTEIPPEALAIGVPAKIRPNAASGAMLVDAADSYVRRGPRYKAELRRLD